MTNRHERRAARKRGLFNIQIDYGYLYQRDPNFGTQVICYGCGAGHKALNFARITVDNGNDNYFPVCGTCFGSDERGNDIARKFMNAPDLKFTEGGTLTTEQFNAMVGKPDPTEH